MRPKKSILCVDDNEQSLSIRKVMLETRGYRVITASSANDALEVFRRGGIDLVLSDVVLPDTDGRKLIQQIKASHPETRCILFSGKITTYDTDTPADVFLPKGTYAPVELLERIRLLLVRKRGPKRAGVALASRALRPHSSDTAADAAPSLKSQESAEKHFGDAFCRGPT
jgi:two-component system, OmpR family, response regulator CpxR